MRQNEISQIGVHSLSLSASFHEQTSNVSTTQTQGKQFIKNGFMPSFTEAHGSTCTTVQEK